MKPTSLRRELTRASMLTTAIVLVVCAGALVAYELVTYRNFWAADLRTQADLIAQSSAAALVFDDPKVARENLALLQAQPRLQVAAIFDRDGRVFASSANAGGGADALPPSAVGPPPRRSQVRFDGALVEIEYPIQHESERVGTVFLRVRHDLLARVVSYAAILTAVMAAGLGIAYFVFGRQLGRVTRPLQQMTDVAQEVMLQRNWALRAPPTEYQDFGVLVHAFNGMLSECESRTAELEAEMAERINAERELRLADRRKDEFLATLAHELRNPLAPMSTSVALLKMAPQAGDAQKRSLAILERQLAQMVRLIDDLLDVSRISTGKLFLQREAVDLVVLLRQVVETALPAAARKQLALALQVPDEPLVLSGDPARLSQVFSNLLNNACRYTEPGGSIDVTLARFGDRVEVAVRDTGIGIEPALQRRIFELFEQGDKSLERGNSGLGIGLTLARQLVRLHGGDIRVDSEGAGRGSCFTVSLPLAALAPEAPHDAAAPAAPHVAGWRVLVADDNVDFASSLAELLRTLRCEVEIVHDGEQAVEVALRTRPQLALLDIGMPKLNGYDVARRLRESEGGRSIRLVAITGWGQEADRRAAERAGFDAHLVKPVEPHALLAVMAALRNGGS